MRSEKGLASIALIIFIVAIASVTAYFALLRKPSEIIEQTSAPTQTNQSPATVATATSRETPEPKQTPPSRIESPKKTAPQKEKTDATFIGWTRDNTGAWRPSSNPPECPSPFILMTPVDLNKATSILYPGQYRGTDYKPHGGFRFDHSKNSEITVIAPFDAYVFRGSRYIAFDEIQYAFDFVAPCGIAYRFGHLLTLSPKFAAIAEKFPEPKLNDSRTTDIESPIFVKTGEVVATAVGFEKTMNVSMDWGVYDLRHMNTAAEDPAWRTSHELSEFSWYGVCWLDWLPQNDAVKARSLPGGDSVNGKQSDYCK